MVWPPASIKHLTLHYSGHCSYGQSHLVYVLIVCHPGKGAAGWLGDHSWAGEGVTGLTRIEPSTFQLRDDAPTN